MTESPIPWLLQREGPRVPPLPMEPWLSEFAAICHGARDMSHQDYLEEKCPGCGHIRAIHAPEACRAAGRRGFCRCPEYDKLRRRRA